MVRQIRMYTDGACKGNGQANARGGWAVVLDNGVSQLRLSAGEDDTTNNRMELKAAVEGLLAIKKSDATVVLTTDSKYLQKGCNEWLSQWKERGWKLANGKPVMNRDLWEQLDEVLDRLSVTFRWVKGHSGDPMNTLVDNLASAAVGKSLVSVRTKSGNTRFFTTNI